MTDILKDVSKKFDFRILNKNQISEILTFLKDNGLDVEYKDNSFIFENKILEYDSMGFKIDGKHLVNDTEWESVKPN